MAIVVSVQEKKPRSALADDEVIPPEIDGVPTDVVEEKIVLHSERVALREVTPLVDTTTYPTLQGGISMGPCRAVFLAPPDVPTAGNYITVGTLGAIVTDRAGGARMALTNFHVACVDSTWAVGDTMTQPSRVDGGTCPTNQFGATVRAVLSENVDGAVVSIDAGRSTACSVVEIGDIEGTNTATVGMAVRKRGRTSGLTYGSITSIDQTVSIDYGDGLGMRTLRHQLRIEVDATQSSIMSDHGDSGSVVVDGNGNVVGLLFAGIDPSHTVAFANPIQAVLDELSINMCASNVSIITRPIVCQELVTRRVVCVLTRPRTCGLVTKAAICSLVTTPRLCVVQTHATCPVVTKICPPQTRACPIRPGEPDSPFGSTGDRSYPGDWYGAGDVDPVTDAFWEGYYAALDTVMEAQADRKA